MESSWQVESNATRRESALEKWPSGEFYVPGFSSDERLALIPGAADTHRRLFLVRAAKLEPDLLTTLRAVDDSESAMQAWAARWHLADLWCVLLAADTKRWWADHEGADGWGFENSIACAGHFPCRIEPLRFGPFYYDPTRLRCEDFQKHVLAEVRGALKQYCDRVAADAAMAGLKRTPRKREIEHFDWLVRYQIKGESFASIAKTSSYKFTGGRQTIRKAVVELAHYLALSLRPST